MNTSIKIFGLLLGIVLAAALAVAGYFALRLLLSLFVDLEAQIAKVTAIGAVAILLASIMIASAVREAGRKIRASQLLPQRADAYVRFLELEASRGQPGREVAAEDLEWRLRVLGSAATVDAISRLRRLERELGMQHADVRLQRARVMSEMRKDIGTEVPGTVAKDADATGSPSEQSLVASGWLR
jgi:hypothetical protein